MANILILAALPEEGDALFPGRGERGGGSFAARRLTTDGHALSIAICGLGKVNAALCAGMLGGDTDMLMMSGTCGSLGAAPGAYWLAEAVQHDYGANEPGLFRRYRAGEWPIGEAGEAHFAAMADPGLGLPHARIASGDSFVACPQAAADLADTLGATLVDMEVAAVAQVATRLGKPWAAIKAVTDEANGESAGDFHANLVRAARLAAQEVERLVAAI
ncbi:5'-methylthioadenosine/S-adenosylhomocysteine nucleosidase [Sphingopyxis sp. BSN-002]|uniref:5'-methylthioadenosine/S-adenosylhomocysteine nucleosidase family protein n=1 Tax=Sphingopyxis sp. BSN-002 TaxID=2911495 RepID=UPI001EDA46B6|nr:5'-methylthioadenosine/S-adenosylhomocysteine nucleosidase [Sphingopyxis sp. BSN-002]UKK83414.1 5'-methylthioadenosine/S-adenosylhomocysteine nucleosidase [Sphingopyxis sp. BSN-002]